MFTSPCLSVFLSGRIRLSITLTEFHKKAIHRVQMPSKTRDTGSLFRFSGHFGLSVHLYCNRIHVVNKYNQLYQIKCMYFMGCQRNRSFSGGCSSDSYLSRNFKNPQPASPDTPPGHLHHWVLHTSEKFLKAHATTQALSGPDPNTAPQLIFILMQKFSWNKCLCSPAWGCTIFPPYCWTFCSSAIWVLWHLWASLEEISNTEKPSSFGALEPLALWDLGQTSMEELVPWFSVWQFSRISLGQGWRYFEKKICIILKARAILMENTDKYECNFMQHLFPRKFCLFTEKQLCLEVENFMSKL